ncbi:hypothetical protein D2Q93_15260 [Alicyclobacillaceae bacterium I2511]|nr:hypothetical protein D2Q93_15260 [Alicyclobacillaceae bacterium I2511]
MKKVTPAKVWMALGTSLLVPLTVPISAFAATSFDSQYQANVTQEAALLQTAQSGTVTTAAGQSFSNQVQNLNSEISSLYSTEQTLAQNSQSLSTSISNQTSQLQQLQTQRKQLLQESQVAWNQYSRYIRGNGRNFRGMAQSYHNQWLKIGEKVLNVNGQLAGLNPSNQEGNSEYQQGLSSLQNSILSLQSAEIADTQQWINLEQNAGSGSIGSTISSTGLTAPTLVATTDSNGNPEIAVSNAQPGATVVLYSSNGTQVSSTVADDNGNATFDNVATGTYYGVQSLNGQQSGASGTVTITSISSVTSLSAPTIAETTDSNGNPEIVVSNAQPGATVVLYSSNGTQVSSTVADDNGNATFDNVATGTYYGVQNLNGQQSGASGTVTINGTSSLLITNANAQFDGLLQTNITATVNLAVTRVQIIDETNGNTLSTATPSGGSLNVQIIGANSGDTLTLIPYEGNTVEQPVNVTVTENLPSTVLTAPTLVATTDSNGNPEIVVSNAQPGANLVLYSSMGTVVNLTSADDNGNGVFDNVANGTYDVVQIVNGQQSSASNSVTVA